MRVIRFKQLRERVPYTRMHIDRLEKAGKFPKRIHLGPNSVGWLDHEVEAWIAARAETRGGCAVPDRVRRGRPKRENRAAATAALDLAYLLS